MLYWGVGGYFRKEVPDWGDIWAGEKSVGRVLGWVVAKGAGRGSIFSNLKSLSFVKQVFLRILYWRSLTSINFDVVARV